MASWQKRARIGVAIFGFVFAGIVYSAIRERPPSAALEPVRRADPKAIAEIYSAVLDQLSGTERPYEITFVRAQQYDDGSTRLFGVRVTVRNRGGRDFVITADEARAANGETDLRLMGNVKVVASDGFELATQEATFDQNTGVARAAGAVSFRKGRMSGSGVGMNYDQPNDVLRFEADARVLATDDEGNTALEFTAGASTFDRPRNVLALEKTVHALRSDEVIDAETVVARLTDNDDIVTYLELRGNARVGGGDVFESMSARSIDLDYTEDGETLERAVLEGNAEIAMATAEGSTQGRRMSGGGLDLQLASDGSLTSATGRSVVRVDLPAADAAPARSIQAETFESTGEPGKGLTAAIFTSPACTAGASRDLCVVYREERAGATAGTGSGASREARSRRLAVSLVDDAVTGATFTGEVSFEEQGLTASASEAIYEPQKGRLSLNGRGGRARVEEEQITVEGATIDVGLDSRGMTARGQVETELRRGEATTPEGGSKMPRLLSEGESVQVSADVLEYAGSGGQAVYTGNAILSQGASTTIRGRTIAIDRETGDLTATGEAISRLVLDDANSVGRAHEIRYEDARRTIVYSPAAVEPTTRTEEPLVQLNVPDGDVTAGRIEVVLGDGSAIDRLEAYGSVTVTVGVRRATGARLTFYAKEGRYVMNSAPGVPLRILDRSSNSCSETTGSTLIFFKGTDRMTVDGKEFMRTQTKGGGSCGPLPSPR